MTDELYTLIFLINTIENLTCLIGYNFRRSLYKTKDGKFKTKDGADNVVEGSDR